MYTVHYVTYARVWARVCLSAHKGASSLLSPLHDFQGLTLGFLGFKVRALLTWMAEETYLKGPPNA